MYFRFPYINLIDRQEPHIEIYGTCALVEFFIKYGSILGIEPWVQKLVAQCTAFELQPQLLLSNSPYWCKSDVKLHPNLSDELRFETNEPFCKGSVGMG